MNHSPYFITEMVTEFLNICGIRETSHYVQKVLSLHPNYPSLLSIEESLLEWGFHTKAVQGTINDLSAIDFPSISHLKSDDYTILESKTDDTITIIFPGVGRKVFTLDAFAKIWSGVLLRLLPEKDAHEDHFHLHKKQQRWSYVQRFFAWPSLALFIIGAFFYLHASQESIPGLLLLGIIKMIGMGLCFTLFIGHSGRSHILNQICPAGKTINCQQVINSPAGKLLGIPMSDIGVLYFLGGFLVILFMLLSSSFGTSMLILGVLAILTLPYSFFSIFYQKFIIRSWCWLCLCVQVLFWLEVTILYKYVAIGLKAFPRGPLFPVVFGFGLAIFTWLALRPIFIHYPQFEKTTAELSRLRTMPELIQMQLDDANSIQIPIFPIEIAMGPIDASITLLQVINPLCNYCGQSLEDMKQAIQIAPNQIRGIVRFLVDSNNITITDAEKQRDYQVAQHITALMVSGKSQEAWKALSSWFTHQGRVSNPFFLQWCNQYGVQDNTALLKASELLRLHENWAKQAIIKRTPAHFINGIELPTGLRFADLKYYLMRQVNP